MKVGFIGLGTMGGPIALNALKGGHELIVHDIRREAAEPHLKESAEWAASPSEVAAASEVIFTSLPGPKEVEAVALGEDGLISALEPGKAYFDLTTNSPTLIRKIHGIFLDHGVETLDAPVSGGPQGALTGRMAIWVGGDEPTFERHLPLLKAMGDKPYYVGPIGSGAIAKLVHNCSGYILQTALAETFSMGVKAGLDPKALWQAVRQGAQGRRRTFDSLALQFLPGRFDPPDFALALAHKDVGLAVELGRELDVPMRLAGMTLEELASALERGWEGRDSRSAMLLQMERAGVDIKVPVEDIEKILEEN
jgi:3-hydroxyisobutyrate dehydrogenase